jgi:hypothetical protein
MENVSVKNIHKSLNEEGYICNVDFAALVTSAIKSKPVGGAFLYGPAGTGKSYLPMVLSKVLNLDMYFFQCSAGTREDDLVLKMMPSENTKSGIEIKKSTVFQAAESSLSGKVLLVLDEWDKTRPTADGFFLDFLQYGRLSIPGENIKANLDNMTIFFTANDEREFHEALLRRFPKIDINPLEPSLVMSALKQTHGNHPHLASSIKLYETAVMSGMSKPATIQEIRQLLDAITLLGDGSDWNSLVYQYITKTPENHELLRKAEGTIFRSKKNIKNLNHSSYQDDSKPAERSEKDSNGFNPIMPKITKSIIKSPPVEDNSEMPDDENVYALFEYNEDNYNYISRIGHSSDLEASDDGTKIGSFSIHRDKISSSNPIKLTDYSEIMNLSEGIKGEIVLVDRLCTARDLKTLKGWKDYDISKYSKNEIIARLQTNKFTVDLLWRRDEGLTLILGAKNFYEASIFNVQSSSRRRLLSYTPGYDASALALVCSSRHLSRENIGILNVKNLVEHKGEIIYSFSMKSSDISYEDVVSRTKTLKSVSNGEIFTGDGFEISVLDNDARLDKVLQVRIWKTPTFEAIYDIARLSYESGLDINWKSIPIYYAVEADANKVSKHLCKNGWAVSAKRRGSIFKFYKSVGMHCTMYKFENVVIFAFRYEFGPEGYDNSTMRARFSWAMRIVKMMAKKAKEIG